MWRIFDSTKKLDSFMDDPGNRAYLVECKGELISIVVAPMGEFVRIFKFYNRTKVWRVAYGLGDQTIC
ncbi:unnamed protein product [Linum trigynum]|uniref:F-box protein n=1 Tax=Linum trigynum TaxID=586398 RepID=A0AAV2CM21_9ROSI